MNTFFFEINIRFITSNIPVPNKYLLVPYFIVPLYLSKDKFYAKTQLISYLYA